MATNILTVVRKKWLNAKLLSYHRSSPIQLDKNFTSKLADTILQSFTECRKTRLLKEKKTECKRLLMKCGQYTPMEYTYFPNALFAILHTSLTLTLIYF
jgi:hypothetical protein